VREDLAHGHGRRLGDEGDDVIKAVKEVLGVNRPRLAAPKKLLEA
jgi:hypothetical protein